LLEALFARIFLYIYIYIFRAFFSMVIWSLTVYPLFDELYLLCVGLACSSLMLLA